MSVCIIFLFKYDEVRYYKIDMMRCNSTRLIEIEGRKFRTQEVHPYQANI